MGREINFAVHNTEIHILLFISFLSLLPAVPRSEVLKLVQLVFVVLMAAMQDDPANKMFFETNVSF